MAIEERMMSSSVGDVFKDVAEQRSDWADLTLWVNRPNIYDREEWAVSGRDYAGDECFFRHHLHLSGDLLDTASLADVRQIVECWIRAAVRDLPRNLAPTA